MRTSKLLTTQEIAQHLNLSNAITRKLLGQPIDYTVMSHIDERGRYYTNKYWYKKATFIRYSPHNHKKLAELAQQQPTQPSLLDYTSDQLIDRLNISQSLARQLRRGTPPSERVSRLILKHLNLKVPNRKKETQPEEELYSFGEDIPFTIHPRLN